MCKGVVAPFLPFKNYFKGREKDKKDACADTHRQYTGQMPARPIPGERSQKLNPGLPWEPGTQQLKSLPISSLHMPQ